MQVKLKTCLEKNPAPETQGRAAQGYSPCFCTNTPLAQLCFPRDYFFSQRDSSCLFGYFCEMIFSLGGWEGKSELPVPIQGGPAGPLRLELSPLRAASPNMLLSAPEKVQRGPSFQPPRAQARCFFFPFFSFSHLPQETQLSQRRETQRRRGWKPIDPLHCTAKRDTLVLALSPSAPG